MPLLLFIWRWRPPPRDSEHRCIGEIVQACELSPAGASSPPSPPAAPNPSVDRNWWITASIEGPRSAGGSLSCSTRVVSVTSVSSLPPWMIVFLCTCLRSTSLCRYSQSINQSIHKSAFIQCGPIKNVALYFCPYLRQLLTDFQNPFTGTLCGQFAIMWLLYFPTHYKCACLYITLRNINKIWVYNHNNKQTFW